MAEEEEEVVTCSICLNALTSDRKPIATVCGHVFCYECLGHWVRKTPQPTTCPQCKTELTDSDDFTRINCRPGSFAIHGHGREGTDVGGGSDQDYMEEGEGGGRYNGPAFRCRRCGKGPAALPVVKEDMGIVYCWACATFDAINDTTRDFWPLYIHTDSNDNTGQGSTYPTLLPPRPRPLTYLQQQQVQGLLSTETSLDDSPAVIQRPSGPPILPNYELSSIIALRLLDRGRRLVTLDRGCPFLFKIFPREHLRFPRIRRYKCKQKQHSICSKAF